MADSKTFSPFEIIEQRIKFKGESSFSDMSCIGKGTLTLGVKTITKKCRGREVKRKTKFTGSGSLVENLHISREILKKMHGSVHQDLIDGVVSYGEDNSIPVFAITQKIEDEDGNILFRAFPCCTIDGDFGEEIDNGGEEVAEREISLFLGPDENHRCMYEALEDDLDDTTIDEWMSNFSTELITKEMEEA